MTEKKPFLVDVPVLILFFNRPSTLEQVFAAVKEARPSVLLLAQDGARADRPDDVEKIAACRKIVEEIDWDCKVYQNYAETNLSCDHREFTALDWAFTLVDRLIILEDDCVPCQTFFPFCAELLERYLHDERVDRICGMNRIETYDAGTSDYLFSTIASGHGWATWKRNWEKVRELADYSFLDDSELVEVYHASRKTIADRNYGDIIAESRTFREQNRASGKITSWENLVGINSLLNSSLIITPKKNMIKNIGATADATHYSELKYCDPIVRRILLMNCYDVKFPLQHPARVIRDVRYEKLHYRKIHRSWLKKRVFKLQVGLKRLFNGDWKGLKKALDRRLKRK